LVFKCFCNLLYMKTKHSLVYSSVESFHIMLIIWCRSWNIGYQTNPRILRSTWCIQVWFVNVSKIWQVTHIAMIIRLRRKLTYIIFWIIKKCEIKELNPLVIKSNKFISVFSKKKKNDIVACVVNETNWEENHLKYDLVF